MEYHGKRSRLFVLGGFICLALASYGIYQGLNCSPTKCSPDPSFWDCAGLIYLCSPIAAFFFTRKFWDIRWNDTHISYRTWYGKRITAPFSAIDDIGYSHVFETGYLLFDGYPNMRLFSDLDKLEELHDTATSALGLKYPHKIYQPAFRYLVDESTECGCLICFSQFSPSDISKWQLAETDLSDIEISELDPYDIACCPNCKSAEAAICNVSKSIISRSEMAKLNEKIEETLDHLEAQRRQKLRMNWAADYSAQL